MKQGAKGALAYRPKNYDLSTDQQARFDQLKANKGKKAAREYLGKQDAKGNLVAKGQAQNPGDLEEMPQVSEPTPFQETQEAVNKGVGNYVNQFMNRPAFTPSQLPEIPGVANGYEASFQGAQNAVMDQFNRRQEPQFQNEQETFRKRMYEQGVPEGSEKYMKLEQQMQQNQNDARLSAQNQAFLTGGQFQQQQFNQGLLGNQNAYDQQYKTHGAFRDDMTALSPFYQTGASSQNLQDQLAYQGQALDKTQAFTHMEGQRQHEYNQQLAQQQHRQTLAQIAATPRGGGGGAGPESFEQWKAKQDYAFNLDTQRYFDQLVAQGGANQQQGPSLGNSFAGGVAAGAGAAAGGWLA